MGALYLICFIPLIVGFYLWITQKEIVWWEWLLSVLIGFATVGIIHGCLYAGMTSDTETWSGHIIRATYYPEWIEEYQEAHTSCSGSGKNEVCTTYYTTEHRTHERYWEADSSTGESNKIEEATFKQISNIFGNYNTEDGNKSGFDGGDPNIYATYNRTGQIYFPTTTTRSWTNIIKATKSNFSFVEIPKNMKTLEYPQNNNWFQSDRLINVSTITPHAWDVLNTELGATKKINLIMIYFGNKDKEQAMYQESAWVGGKKNDLVICYGGIEGNRWSYVFGWTEKSLVKRNLESIILDNKMNDGIIPLIKKEVQENYQIKDFSKFNYMQIDPPSWAYLVTFIIVLLTQVGYWMYSFSNEYGRYNQ